MERQLQEKFVNELDKVLLPLGFSRTKKSQQWKRRIGKADIEWIHLNFGLGVINPSFGVIYDNISNILPKELGYTPIVHKMLTPITKKGYSENTDPQVLAEDILNYAIQSLPGLRARKEIITSLESEAPKDWPVLGSTDRIRLLPILLANEGEMKKALEALNYFEQESDKFDQSIPEYSVFAKYFRLRFAN